MSNLIQIHNSNMEYGALREKAIEMQNIVVELPLSDFDLDLKQTIRVKDKLVPTTEESYNFFLKNVLKIDPRSVTAFKNATDEKTELAMLSVMKSGLSQKSKEVVRVVVNPKNQKIVSFLGKNDKYLSNESLLNLFEMVLNKYSKLDLKDFYLNKSSGELVINARCNQQIDLGKNENFLGGLSFSNRIKEGTSISHSALRLICTNGMVGFKNIPFSFKDTTTGIKNLMNQIGKLDASNYISELFTQMKEEKENSIASIYEMNQVRKVLLNNSNLTEEQVDYYLPYKETYEFLKTRGVSAENLNDSQRKNCPTLINYWDLFNIVTDFGSHDYGLNTNYMGVQAFAGNFLAKKPDSNGFVIFNN